MAIEIRLLENNQYELANNFFNNVYKTNRTIENFRWEFVDGPEGKAIYVIAVDTSETSFVKIAGIQCAIPIELMNADGSYILTAKSEDTLVHPDYRGQKLFEKMYALLFYECKKAGVKYIWGFTPAVKAFERLGFEIPFQTTQALLVFKPFQAFTHIKKLNTQNKFFDKFKILGLSTLSFISGLKRLFVNESKKQLTEVSLTNNKESIIRTFYKQKSYYFLRENEAYLNWRLLKNPFGNQYTNLQFGQTQTSPEADILFNIRAEVSYLEQMFFSPTLDVKAQLQILRKALKKIQRTGVSSVRVLCFENNEEMLNQINLLKKIGFVYLKRGSHFVWKQLQEENTISAHRIFFNRLFTQGNL